MELEGIHRSPEERKIQHTAMDEEEDQARTGREEENKGKNTGRDNLGLLKW